MYCPVCKSVELRMSERQGVEIDYCPQCRGVWLDRGELDKIIEKVAAEESRYIPPSDTGRFERHEEYRRYDDDDYKRHGKKKRSLLDEMFDIF